MRDISILDRCKTQHLLILTNHQCLSSVEGRRDENIHDPLCIPSRFYVKFPEPRATPPSVIEQIGSVISLDQCGSFCVDVLDNELKVDDPELRRIVEENFERLFW